MVIRNVLYRLALGQKQKKKKMPKKMKKNKYNKQE